MAFLNRLVTDYKLTAQQENIEFLLYSTIVFIIPFSLGHPQWLVGTIVNAALVLAGLNLPLQKTLPIIILPSIAVLSRGLLFGPYTPALIYTLPFIWLGNSTLVSALKIESIHHKQRRIIIGIIGKVTLLTISALALIQFELIPKALLVGMSIFQLITAISGALLAKSIHYAKKKYLATTQP